MEPKYVQRDAFNFIGKSYIGKNENDEIKQMWSDEWATVEKLSNVAVNKSECYGFCSHHAEGEAEGVFEYLVCMATQLDAEVPAGMVKRQVPAHTYAVFTHHGLLETLGETYKYIYQTWLPKAGKEIAGDFELEVYDDDFIHDSEDSKFYIYVPVK